MGGTARMAGGATPGGRQKEGGLLALGTLARLDPASRCPGRPGPALAALALALAALALTLAALALALAALTLALAALTLALAALTLALALALTLALATLALTLPLALTLALAALTLVLVPLIVHRSPLLGARPSGRLVPGAWRQAPLTNKAT